MLKTWDILCHRLCYHVWEVASNDSRDDQHQLIMTQHHNSVVLGPRRTGHEPRQGGGTALFMVAAERKKG